MHHVPGDGDFHLGARRESVGRIARERYIRYHGYCGVLFAVGVYLIGYVAGEVEVQPAGSKAVAIAHDMDVSVVIEAVVGHPALAPRLIILRPCRHPQRYNCIIDTATDRVGYVRDFARQQPYAELDASAARFTPADYLSYGEDSYGVPVISHGANSSIKVDKADGYNFEFAFAFVRPDITHDKRITEADCVSNIVPFAVTAYSVDGDTMMTFSTTRPYKRYSVSRNKKVLAEAKD